MDLGIFLPIANNGWIISKTAPQYLPSFDLNRITTQKAEQYGFDFVLSMVKYRGYGGETQHWDYALESFTLMAGLAAATTKIDLYASVQPLTLHPAMAARMAMTVDNISHGRFGINVVAGWNKYEYAQMGLWPGDDFYDIRYDYAQEWVQVVRGLWENGRLTHEGRYFHLDDCLCLPKPSRIPPIVCAGMSDRGLRFTVENGDISFVAGDLESVKQVSSKAKQKAAEMGKSIKSYAVYTVITGETPQMAEAALQHILEGTDAAGLAGLLDASSNDQQGSTAQQLLNDIFIVPPLVGSPEQVADYLQMLATETEIDGVLFTFPDFISGTDFFGKEILPILQERGLRSVQPIAS